MSLSGAGRVERCSAYYTGGLWMPEGTYDDLGGDDYLLHLIQLDGLNITNSPNGRSGEVKGEEVGGVAA